jgi:nitrogenase molybdenum-iron protein alpha/beta subunit
MTGRWTPCTPPDGLTGAILAVEGIADAAVLLNGPTGCKFYHGAIADRQLPRSDSLDPLHYAEEFYFGQPRVPATYLDGDDYVFGAGAKIERILPAVAAKGHRLMAVVNSPGAALIGDDLERLIVTAGLDAPCAVIETTGFSGTAAEGFDTALRSVLRRLDPPETQPVPRRINLLGVPLLQYQWRGNVEELARLLGLCGIEIGAVLCAGSNVDQLRSLRSATLNVVVQEEYGAGIGAFLREQYGMDTIRPECGVPLGFDAAATWIGEVCKRLDADPAPALNDIANARADCYRALSRFHSLTGLPKAVTFAVEADASVALPLTRWLHGYLGMVPDAVRALQATPEIAECLRAFLRKIDCADAWNRDPLDAEIVFASGQTLRKLQAAGWDGYGIPVAPPGLSGVEILPRPFLGTCGAVRLVEEILNGVEQTC